MKFVNKKQELDFLEKQYSSPNASFIVIYGRRRIGKNALIKEFLVGKRHLPSRFGRT
ncbi:MAG: uncharacterized protein PWP09_1699 [Thermotogota bacterium]|nr:uncharacterized protein [Thermotogota bacterium]